MRVGVAPAHALMVAALNNTAYTALAEAHEWDGLAPSESGPDDLFNPVVIRHVMEEVASRGIDPAVLLSGLGYQQKDLEQSDFRLPYAAASETIWRAIKLLQDPDLGLILGARHHIVSWGLVGLGAMASSTLFDAMALGFRYQREAGSLLSLWGRIEGQQASLIASPRFADIRIERVLVDGIFTSIVQAAREILKGQFRPLHVDLVTTQVSSLARYQDLFQCPVYFGCLENRLVVSRKGAASAPHAFAAPAALNGALAILQKDSHSARKPLYLGKALAKEMRARLSQGFSPADMAALFGLGERSLRRKLAQEGTNYMSILDAVRRSRALELLLLARRPAFEVASELGYADVRGLATAYRRWTGRPLPEDQ